MAGGTVSLRYFILGLLTQQPMSGYDIKRFLRSLSWLIGSPSAGSIYPALRALLEEGLVTVSVEMRQDRPPRKVYSIAELGRRELAEWIAQPVDPDASLKAFTMRLILASNYSRPALTASLQRRRAQVDGHRLELEQIDEVLGEDSQLGQRLAVDYALAVARAELGWLERELEAAQEQPTARAA